MVDEGQVKEEEKVEETPAVQARQLPLHSSLFILHDHSLLLISIFTFYYLMTVYEPPHQGWIQKFCSPLRYQVPSSPSLKKIYIKSEMVKEYLKR